MKSLESISYALKQERLAQGLTQRELAEKAHVSRAWLVGMESGTARRAEFGKVLDVVATLGLELNLIHAKPLTADEELVMKRIFDV
jgi:transcriptional regulator with XRE-family HTH domain